MDPGYAHASKNQPNKFSYKSFSVFLKAAKIGMHLPGLLSTSFIFYLAMQRIQETSKNRIIFIYISTYQNNHSCLHRQMHHLFLQ